MNLLFAPKISYLKERDKNTKKSFSSQAACVTIAALMQYFLMAAFLLDADRGNLSLPLRCESL